MTKRFALCASLCFSLAACGGGSTVIIDDDGGIGAGGSAGQTGSGGKAGSGGVSGGGGTAGVTGAGGSAGAAGQTGSGGKGSGGSGSGGAGSGGITGSGGKGSGGSGSGGAGSGGATGSGGKGSGGSGSGGAGSGGATGSGGSTSSTACGAGLTPTITVTTASQLVTAFSNFKSGDVISIAAGTYDLTGKNFSLSASNVKVFGVAGKTILDYKATATTNKAGLDISGSNNYVCGLDFANAGDNGIHISGNSNKIERCKFYGCFDAGLQISGPDSSSSTIHPADNYILNCDSYDNYDTSSSGGNADGFAAKLNIGPGNKFYGCVSHDNSDDGWDMYWRQTAGVYPVTIENCVAYHNGYHDGAIAGNGNGFKVGSVNTGGAASVLKNCVAFNNPSKGLDQNHNQTAVTIDHCTSVNNKTNVSFSEYEGANITNTVANGTWTQSTGTDSGNVKNASTSNFTNLTPASISRAADGTLHLNGFAVYTPSSAGAHF